METEGPRLDELRDRRVEAHRDRRRGLHDAHRAGGAATPSLTGSIPVPRAVHAQVRVQRQPVIEADEQVLAHRVDPVDTGAHDPLELYATGSAACGGHLSPEEHLPEHRRGAEERVALRHRALAWTWGSAGRPGRDPVDTRLDGLVARGEAEAGVPRRAERLAGHDGDLCLLEQHVGELE